VPFILRRWLVESRPKLRDLARLDVLMRDNDEAMLYIESPHYPPSIGRQLYKLRVDDFFACLAAGVFSYPLPPEPVNERLIPFAIDHVRELARACRSCRRLFPSAEPAYAGIPGLVGPTGGTARSPRKLVQLGGPCPDDQRLAARFPSRRDPRSYGP